MKKRFNSVFYSIAIAIACFLAGCNAASEDRASDDAISDTGASMYDGDELEKAFEADTLTEDQLRLFQQRAQQKLADFIDYVGIISNKKYDVELRLAAMEQIEQLFIDSSVQIEVGLTEAEQKARPLNAFIEEVYGSKYDSVSIKALSVKTGLPELKKQMTYRGTITADASIERYKDGEAIFNTLGTYKAETIIRKVQKQFGSDSSTVWTVTLGEIKQVSVALP